MLGVILYEMLVGTVPYRGRNGVDHKNKLKIPSKLSPDCKNLLVGLLQINPKKRLGSSRDAREIKEHPFFAGINWLAVLRKELRPPKPNLSRIIGGITQDMVVRRSSVGVGENHIFGWTFIGE